MATVLLALLFLLTLPLVIPAVHAGHAVDSVVAAAAVVAGADCGVVQLQDSVDSGAGHHGHPRPRKRRSRRRRWKRGTRRGGSRGELSLTSSFQYNP